MTDGPVLIVGVEELAALRRALRTIEPATVKTLQKGLKQAAEIVAAEARSRIPVRSGRAQKSVRAGASGTNAYIAGGKSTVLYYGWLDFGSRTPRTGSSGPWKGSGAGPTGGRFIYPAIRDKFDEFRQAAVNAVDDATRKAGL